MEMIRAKSTHPQIFLICYASPVTKRMLVFNDLTFYSMPPLPANWKAPMWLKVELGILAGRLYFEWDEYRELCDFLAIGTGDEAMLYEEDELGDEGGAFLDAPAMAAAPELRKGQPATASFSKRPLTFIQDWLAVRRHGQDFVHTPMGFLTQSKPLHETHPFFCGISSAGLRPAMPAPAATARKSRPVIVESDEEDHLDGVDDMGANIESDGEDDEGSSQVDESTGDDDEQGRHADDSDDRSWFSTPDDSDSS